MPIKKNSVFYSTLILGFIISLFVYAADLNLLPSTGKFGLGQEFTVDLKIDTKGVSINAAQAKIKFSPAVLEVRSVSKEGSIFSFWLQEPVFSNTDGTVVFIGGTPDGVSGAALQVLKVRFRAKSAGSGNLEIVDGAVTASDGTGRDILEKTNGASFNIVTETVPKTETVPVPTPVPIVRTPVIATALPTSPGLEIPLYPDQEKWYNISSQFAVIWDLPPDVSGIATEVNKNPNYIVPPGSEGLFESKHFLTLEESGIYYVHVRFQNSKGWGPTAHYKISFDTEAPLAFKINVKTGSVSDNPSPVLAFETADALSGIDSYIVKIGNEETISVSPSETASEHKFKPHLPGIYMIVVTALDKAGNSIESRTEIEILPIATPAVTFITEKVIKGETLTVKGTALPNVHTVISILDKDRLLVLEREADVNEAGEWTFYADRELRTGKYFVSVKAKDERGAVSLPTEFKKVNVVEKPLISIFGLDITPRRLILILVIAFSAAGFYTWRRIITHQFRTKLESLILGRDLGNMLGMGKKEIDDLLAIFEKNIPAESKVVELRYRMDKLKTLFEKIRKYIGGGVEKLD